MESSKEGIMPEGKLEVVKGPNGTFKRYFLSGDELKKYRDMPQDDYWKTNSKPHVTPVAKTKTK
ncbi:MAG: hypothetical protein K6T94_21895 [Paenibacillus sp.]|nr:hypothetical protein [Paenibacillus sp.]